MLESINSVLFANGWTITLTFVAALYLLIKASDLFTINAEKLGLIIGIPAFVVGLTIVSVGTSLPELATSFFAVIKGESEIVAGNVVGSNIANLLLVIGIVALVVRHIKVEWDLVQVDLPLLMGSTFILGILLWDGALTPMEGIFCLIGYAIYVRYSLSHRNKKHQSSKTKMSPMIPTLLVVSVVVIYFSAEYVINSIVAFVSLPSIASLGINTSMIAITAVAVGTSLPEVSVSISAARRKNFELALGNVIGSNIFNSFVVMSLPSFLGVLTVSQTVTHVAIPFMIAATLLYVVATQDREVSFHEGAFFLLLYGIFIAKLFNLI